VSRGITGIGGIRSGLLAGGPLRARGPYVAVRGGRGGWDTDTWGCHNKWVKCESGWWAGLTDSA
jgi:hypothetical protein